MYLTSQVHHHILSTVNHHCLTVWFTQESQRSLNMYARNVSLNLKANTAREFTQTLEKDVLPLLRKQTGFKDEISFVAANGAAAVAISLWDRKEDAETYSRDTYPQVLKSLAKVVEGTPTVARSEERRVGKVAWIR